MATVTRLAARGALGAIGGLGATYAAFVLWLTRPNGAGIDAIEAWIGWLSVGCVVAAPIAVHAVYARVLAQMAAGRRFSVERSW
jgi:hypothetical protein